MVVGYRASQLLKTSKTVNFSNKFPLGLSTNSFGYNSCASLCFNSAPGDSKVSLVRLWRNCRRLHYSKETSRSAMTKLSPPECSLACFSQVTSNKLTKEVDVQSFFNSDIQEQFVNLIFQSSPRTIENVDTLLTRSAILNVPDVIDSFNTGINYNILVLSEGFIKVNSAVLETALLKLAKDVTKSLFPNDKFQQLMAYTVLQKQIKETTKKLPAVIDQNQIPVAVLSAAVSEPAYKVGKVQQRAGLLVELQYEICNSTLNYVGLLISSSITNAEAQLAAITVGSSTNVALTKLIEFLISIASQGLTLLDSLTDSLGSILCDSLLIGSRKRRDVEVVSAGFDRSVLENVGSRNISSAATNLLNVFYAAISTVLKEYLISGITLWFTSLQTYVENGLATLFATLTALIDQYL